jgi:hypothetical protein
MDKKEYVDFLNIGNMPLSQMDIMEVDKWRGIDKVPEYDVSFPELSSIPDQFLKIGQEGENWAKKYWNSINFWFGNFIEPWKEFAYYSSERPGAPRQRQLRVPLNREIPYMSARDTEKRRLARIPPAPPPPPPPPMPANYRPKGLAPVVRKAKTMILKPEMIERIEESSFRISRPGIKYPKYDLYSYSMQPRPNDGYPQIPLRAEEEIPAEKVIRPPDFLSTVDIPEREFQRPAPIIIQQPILPSMPPPPAAPKKRKKLTRAASEDASRVIPRGSVSDSPFLKKKKKK